MHYFILDNEVECRVDINHIAGASSVARDPVITISNLIFSKTHFQKKFQKKREERKRIIACPITVLRRLQRLFPFSVRFILFSIFLRLLLLIIFYYHLRSAHQRLAAFHENTKWYFVRRSYEYNPLEKVVLHAGKKKYLPDISTSGLPTWRRIDDDKLLSLPFYRYTDVCIRLFISHSRVSDLYCFNGEFLSNRNHDACTISSPSPAMHGHNHLIRSCDGSPVGDSPSTIFLPLFFYFL